MSIIYDALKKTESKLEDIKDRTADLKPNKPKLFFIVYFIFALILIALVSTTTKTISRRLVSKTAQTPLISTPSSVLDKISLPTNRELPPLSLTGIFFSDGQAFALINNQMVKAGDFIEDCQILKIDSNGVEIKFEDSSFRLNYP